MKGKGQESMGKKVSIVMPVLNGMPYFVSALDSVRSQSLKDIEILIIDAGSTDGTLEYIKKCCAQDSRLRCIQSEKRSMGHQYNLGLLNAQAEYVGFCESDDYMETDAMEYLYGLAVSHDKPDCVKSVFGMFIDKSEKFELDYSILPRNRLDLYDQSINIDELPELFFRDVNMWNGIYKKEFIDKQDIKLNETAGAAFQDIGFVLQVHLLAVRTVYGDKKVYHYRKDNEGSSIYNAITGKFSLDEIIYILNILNRHPECKRKYLNRIINRTFGLFSANYGKNLYCGVADQYKDSILAAQKQMQKYYGDLTFSQKSCIQNLGLLNTFLNSINDFETVVRNNYRNRIENLYRFWEYLKEKENGVIFGCGERGQSIAGCLVKNKYQGKLIFCDNQIERKTKIVGIDVYPVDHVVGRFPKAAFIVSNGAYFYSMQKQLLLLGIKADQVICAPMITPFSSLEIDFSQD